MQYKVGIKQTLKVLEQQRAIEVYVARDADPNIQQSVLHACERMGVPVKRTESMKSLGVLCGIDVGAAAAALVQDE